MVSQPLYTKFGNVFGYLLENRANTKMTYYDSMNVERTSYFESLK